MHNTIQKILYTTLLLSLGLLYVPQVFSVAGDVQLDVSTGGQIIGSALITNKFTDAANTDYYLDPAASTTSLTVAGNVGIGTTAPGAKLDVAGTGNFTGTITAPTFSGNLNGAAPWGSVSGRPGWLSGGSYVESLSNANTIANSGFYENGGCGTNWPSCTWYNSLNIRHSNQANGHGFQIAMSYYDNKLWFRSYQGGIPASYQA